MKKRFNRSIKTALCLLLAAALCLSLSACTSIFDFGNDTVPSRAPVEHIDHITIGTTAAEAPENISDRAGYSGQFNYTGMVYAPLFVKGEFYRIRGYFILDYAVSEDGREIRVAFPTTFKWHDGEPVTFEDLVFTLEYRRDILQDEALANLKEIRKTADNQAVLVFSAPDAYKYLHSESALQPLLAKHAWDNISAGAPADLADAGVNVGCGPYKLSSAGTDTSELELFPGNDYLGEARIDKITIKTYPDKEALINALAAHEIDYIYCYDSPMDYTLAELFTGKEGLDPGSVYGADMDAAVFFTRLPSAEDARFRRAVLLSIDWEALRQMFCADTGSVPSAGFLSPSAMGFDSSMEKFKTDLEESARQLEKAGFKDADEDGFRELPDGRPFVFRIVTQDLPERQELYDKAGALIAEGLKKVGINAAYLGSVLDADAHETPAPAEPSGEEGEDAAEPLPDGFDLIIGRTQSGKDMFRTAAAFFTEVFGDALPQDDYFTRLNDTLHALQDSLSDEEYLQNAGALQKLIEEDLYGFALCWEEYFFPYRTDEFEGQSFLPDTGEVNYMLFYRIKKK